MKLENIKRAYEVLMGEYYRRQDENVKILELYYNLTVNCPTRLSKEFNKVKIRIINRVGNIEEFYLELTPADYLWWKTKFEQGCYIEGGFTKFKEIIFNRMADMSSSHDMLPSEREEFIKLFS